MYKDWTPTAEMIKENKEYIKKSIVDAEFLFEKTPYTVVSQMKVVANKMS